MGAFPLIALLLLGTNASPGRAQRAGVGSNPAPAATPAPAPSPQGDTAAAARAHFDAALAHYRERRFREAIREFELSLSIVPNADVWFDLGRAHEQLGELDEAIDNYRRYLRDRVDATDALQLRAHIAELLERIASERAARARNNEPARGSLAIDADQPGARVTLDGRELGTAPLERIVPVAPGPHRVSARRTGFVPFDARIDVQPGAVSAAYVRLAPLRSGPSAEAPRLATCVLAGAGALAVLTGATLALASGAERNARRFGSADDLGVGSRVSFGAALGLAAGAMLAYVLEAKAGVASERSPRERAAALGATSLTLSKSR